MKDYSIRETNKILKLDLCFSNKYISLRHSILNVISYNVQSVERLNEGMINAPCKGKSANVDEWRSLMGFCD